jgi:uncharacterized protein YijF (DUF1287 family)
MKPSAYFFAAIIIFSFFGSAQAEKPFADKLADAAYERTKKWVIYNGKYYSISYPGGDVPSYIGVCTDVVIRSYRAVGIDLQKEVHEDMRSNFNLYPKTWGHKRPDTNIDHRRVPNLRVFFSRKGESLTVTSNPSDYKPGDLVTWNLRGRGNLPHIGIITSKKSDDNKRPLVSHNIGLGPRLENMLFDYPITGHYRYPGKNLPK